MNAETKLDALNVIFGSVPMPDRSDVDEWMETRDTAMSLWELSP